MKGYLSIAGICLAVLCFSPSAANDLVKGGQPGSDATGCCLPPRVAVCPDDYCRKPFPCPPVATWWSTCDDYCRKPIPCTFGLSRCGSCDDYCRKPLPGFCWAVLDGVRCVPSCSACNQTNPGKAVRPGKTVTTERPGASK